MITYSQLGRNGRLGNQMFQYALLLGIQAKLGYNIVINDLVKSLKKGLNSYNYASIYYK